jgi:hypothetical protein
MYKECSNIIYDMMYKWDEKFDKIDEAKAGFQVCYSTIDNISI